MAMEHIDATKPHWVYRQYDEAGTLLYVGMSGDPVNRMIAHRAKSPWYPDTKKVVMDWYPNRAIAQAAERFAIESEGPVHNAVHARQLRAPKPSKPYVPETVYSLHEAATIIGIGIRYMLILIKEGRLGYTTVDQLGTEPRPHEMRVTGQHIMDFHNQIKSSRAV